MPGQQLGSPTADVWMLSRSVKKTSAVSCEQFLEVEMYPRLSLSLLRQTFEVQNVQIIQNVQNSLASTCSSILPVMPSSVLCHQLSEVCEALQGRCYVDIGAKDQCFYQRLSMSDTLLYFCTSSYIYFQSCNPVTTPTSLMALFPDI